MAFIEFETALKAFHGFSANNFRNWFLSFFIHLRNAEDVYWKIVRETQLLEIKFPLEANGLRLGEAGNFDRNASGEVQNYNFSIVHQT